MLIGLIATELAIVLFLCIFIGFKQGLRWGMQASKGIEPQPIKLKNPIKIVKEIKEEHVQAKEEKKYNDELEKMMNYTGDVE